MAENKKEIEMEEQEQKRFRNWLFENYSNIPPIALNLTKLKKEFDKQK